MVDISEGKRELPVLEMENGLERSRCSSHSISHDDDERNGNLIAVSLPHENDFSSKFISDKENEASSSSSCSSTLDVYDFHDEEFSEETSHLVACTRLKKRKVQEKERKVEGGILDGDVESTMTRPEDFGACRSSRRGRTRSRIRMSPTDEELDDFFAEAEKKIQNKKQLFIDKYNYDIVRDEPLEGRYEWLQLSP